MREGFDRELDSLLRRAARDSTGARGNGAGASRPASHLDADELAAYAEGALPEAARLNAVSHLADCDDCRSIAVGITRAAGVEAELEKRALEADKLAAAVPARESEAVKESKSVSGWLASLFAPRALRYVAPVLAVCLVAAVSFVALRSRRDDAPQVAQEEPGNADTRVSINGSDAQPLPESQTASVTSANANTSAGSAPAAPGPTGAANANTAAPAPRQEKDADASKGGVLDAGSDAARPAESKAGEAAAAAPPPPAPQPLQKEDDSRRDVPVDIMKSERVESLPAPKVGVNTKAGGPPASSASDDELASEQSRNAQKRAEQPRNMDVQAPDGGSRAQNRPAANNAAGGVVASRRARNSQDAPAAEPEREEEARSAAGHRFRRDGGAWVDVNYKPSMASTGVRRGSDSYRALVADIPEIGRVAEQLGGEVIVVVRGRAYRIR
jgi:hypothetical protein